MRVLSAALAVAMVVGACTDLEVEELDSKVIVTASGEFAGVNPTASLASAYGDIRGYADQANLYALLEVSSDEYLVPTRGTDWGDNGVWRVLHTHQWDATHQFMVNAWNNLNSNVFRLNQLLHPKSNPSAAQAAEGKFLRALNMFYIYDLWRQIPFRNADDPSTKDPEVLSGQAAFDFIVKDLDDAIAGLPTKTAGAQINANTQASKAAARFLKAKMLLNKHIYLNSASPAAADMTAVITLVNEITADGFALATAGNYFSVFQSSSDSETIFWTDSGVGNRMWNGLHYAQNSPDNGGGGWNGFSTTADIYALFEGSAATNEPGNGQEERRGFVPNQVTPPTTTTGIGYGFLVGQQYENNGTKLKDRAGNDLVFTKDFPGLAGNNERTGIRIIKYHPDNGAFTNHYILFRYADAYLMKVEALLRGGTDTLGQNAEAMFDALRTQRGAATNLTATLPELLRERARELYIEGWRRNDQIRFGTWANTWPLKDNTESFRLLFPIPALALSSNPNLTQNPGY